MRSERFEGLEDFLHALGLEEEPLGMFFTDTRPQEGFSPKPLDLPTREREIKNQIDWGATFGGFSCVMGHIWRARRKRSPAWFSAENFGCPGGAFWLGFLKPQTETIVHYVSSGVPGRMEGECYLANPDDCRGVFEFVDPPAAAGRYAVFKPLGLFTPDEEPVLVSFFCRPESLCGLHQLATYVTGRPEVVRSPFSAGCGSLAAWPLHYLAAGEEVAVLGGWDPSARKFFKTDELSFTIPYSMFKAMLQKWPGSFLTKKVWRTVAQKVTRSKKAWAGK